MKTTVKLLACIIVLASCSNDPSPQKDVNWKKVDLETTTNLQAIFFVNGNVGFVGGTQRAKLSAASNQLINDDYFPYIESVHINTDSTKYFYKTVSANNPEPTLFKTTDGGNSLESLETPFVSSITDIFFLDERTGYVATEYEGIHKTTDGGKTWKSVISNIAFLGEGRILENPFNKLYFLNEMEGFAYHRFNHVMAKTIDGGASWALVPSFDPKNANGGGLISMVFLPDNLTGYGIGGPGLLKTMNGGMDWDTLRPKLLPEFLNTDNYFRIEDLSIVDENTAFMLHGGTPFVSRDGAVTWERIESSRIPLPMVERIQPINENEFYILSQSNQPIFYVNIADQECVPMTIGRSETQINDWFFAGGKGFAVGPNGLFLKYEGN